MTIKIEHGQISTTAQLAAKAGAAEQTIRDQEQNIELQKIMLQRVSQKEHDLLTIQHDISLKQYEAELNFEAQKSQRAWELEKQMLRSRQQFDILLAKEGLDQQQMIQKLGSVQEAFDNGLISEEDANALRIKIQTGTFSPSTILGMKSNDSMEDLAAQILGNQVVPNKTLETRTIGADEIVPSITFPDGTRKRVVNGEVIEETPADQAAQAEEKSIRGKEIRENATQPAYFTEGFFRKKVPNISAMKSKMFLLMDSPDISDSDKGVLQRILSSGNDEAIRAYYDRLVDAGLLQRENPVNKRQFEKLTQNQNPSSDVFEGVEFYGV